MKIVRVSSLSVQEGDFHIVALMVDKETNTTIHKHRKISDALAVKFLKAEADGALVSRFSRSVKIGLN